jgi:hypothetical protein
MGRIGRFVENEVQQKIDRLKFLRDKSVKTVLVYDGEFDASIAEDGFSTILYRQTNCFAGLRGVLGD